VQDLEGDLGLVLGVEREFADGFAEVGERRGGHVAADGVGFDLWVEQQSELIVLIGAAFGLIDWVLDGVVSQLFANRRRDVYFCLVS